MEIIPFLPPSTYQLLAYYSGVCSFVLEKWGINGECLPCLTARGLGLPPTSSQQPARCHFTLWWQDSGLDTPARLLAPVFPQLLGPCVGCILLCTLALISITVEFQKSICKPLFLSEKYIY